MSRRGAAVLAVDGGNSKIDLALVSRSGELLALVNGPTISHQQVPMEVAVERLVDLNVRAAREAGVATEASRGVLLRGRCRLPGGCSGPVARVRRIGRG